MQAHAPTFAFVTLFANVSREASAGGAATFVSLDLSCWPLNQDYVRFRSFANVLAKLIGPKVIEDISEGRDHKGKF